MNNENENQISLPSVTVKKKRGGLFSFAIFKEELKSNWLYSLIVGLGNALIIILIVSIMSTLNINATKDALNSLFSSASEETTLKSSSVSLYALYTSSAEGYLKVDNGIEQIGSYFEQVNSTITSSDTSTSMLALKAAYDGAYRLSSGDEESKKKAGINTSTVLYNTAINAMEDGVKKDFLKALMPEYVNFYAEKGYGNENYDYKWGLCESIEPAFKSFLRMKNSLSNMGGSSLSYGDLVTAALDIKLDELYSCVSVAKNNLESVLGFNSKGSSITDGLTLEEGKFETALELLPTFAGSSYRLMAREISTSLLEAYSKDKSTFLEEKEKHIGEVLKPAVVLEAKKTIESMAYYEYLPSFPVEWVTNDLGYPITYHPTGELNPDGTEVVEEVKLIVYRPDLFVKVTGGMPSSSNLAQKMHKDILTGEPYSEEEIKQAKKEASEALDTAYTKLDAFLDDFISNKDLYVSGNSIDEIAIENRVLKEVVIEAKALVLEEYNKKFNTVYTDIEDIPSSSSYTSGKAMLNSIYTYGSAGIGSFRALKTLGIQDRGYNENDALIFATSASSLGIIDQLPTSVRGSLNEMGQMNTYGIFVGVVSFGLACVLLPLVSTIVLSSNLVASKVENGSLAFTLTTPIRRTTFVFTEAVYLILTEIFLGVCLFLGALVSREIGIQVGGGDLIESLSIHDISLYAFGSCLLMVGISGICFLSSCLFNKSGKAIGVGGGLNISFFIASILGLFGTEAIPGTVRIETMNYFNYVTILSLYDGMAVMDGDPIYWFKLLALVGIALITYGFGIYYFDHKDLPL